METIKGFALLKSTDASGTTVLGVYLRREDVEARLDNIQRSNPQYELKKLAENSWVIGPEEDEGFFGHKPVYFGLQEVTIHKPGVSE